MTKLSPSEKFQLDLDDKSSVFSKEDKVPNNDILAHEAVDKTTYGQGTAAVPPSRFSTFKVMFVTLGISTLAASTLIADYVVSKHSPFTSERYHWVPGRANIPLAVLMLISSLYSLSNIFVTTPWLAFAFLIEMALFANMIPQLVHLISGFPKSEWCRVILTIPSPGSNTVDQFDTPATCKHWMWAITLLSAISAALGIAVSSLYVWRVLRGAVGWWRGEVRFFPNLGVCVRSKHVRQRGLNL